MIKIISWNIAHRHAPWRCLPDSADIALLQEARRPPDDVENQIEVDPVPFPDANRYVGRSAIANISKQVKMDWLDPVPLAEARPGDFSVSHPGTLSAAIVSPLNGESFEPFTIVSLCAEYEKPHRSTGKMSWDIIDASVHRVISDLSLLIGRQSGHRIIAAGDLSVYYGWGWDKSDYWKCRYATVFKRMDALGIPLVGPEAPNGRQTDPSPKWLPKGSKNVPTYRHSSGTEHQLDFVFASESMKDSVKKVSALNYPDDWGPKPLSDHCQIEILVEP